MLALLSGKALADPVDDYTKGDPEYREMMKKMKVKGEQKGKGKKAQEEGDAPPKSRKKGSRKQKSAAEVVDVEADSGMLVDTRDKGGSRNLTTPVTVLGEAPAEPQPSDMTSDGEGLTSDTGYTGATTSEHEVTTDGESTADLADAWCKY